MIPRRALVLLLAGLLALPGVAAAARLSGDVRVGEAAGSVSISVTALPGAVLNWSTRDGSATAGSDYGVSGATLTFGSGETTKTIAVPILNDAAVEPAETLTVAITSIIGDIQESPGAVTVTIADDDGRTGPCGTTIVGTAGPDTLNGTAGGDTVRGLGGDDAINGLLGVDCLLGGPGRDRILGQDGNDRILGGSGDDTLVGGSGRDDVRGDGGADDIAGEEGADRLSGGQGADLMRGGAGDDTLLGGPGDDTLRGDDPAGAPGADTIVGGPGADMIVAGAGNDRVDARDGDADRVDCGAGRDTVLVDRLDSVIDCEVVRRR